MFMYGKNPLSIFDSDFYRIGHFVAMVYMYYEWIVVIFIYNFDNTVIKLFIGSGNSVEVLLLNKFRNGIFIKKSAGKNRIVIKNEILCHS